MQRDDPLPDFAGVPTYLRAPLLSVEQLSPGMIAVLGVPTDYTKCSRAGTRYGPRSIREASLSLAYRMGTSANSGIVDVTSGKVLRYSGGAGQLADVGDVHIYPTDVAKTSASIRRCVRDVTERGVFPVILGGDHYITFPAFQGFSDAIVARHSGARIGYIQFDCHLDLADNSPIMGPLFNGSNARRVSELPMVNTSNMVWIGTSGYARTDQWDFVWENGGHAFTVADVHRRGIRQVVEEAWELASEGCDSVYLTIDIDCVDCASVVGTGTPNFDGLWPRELLEAVDLLSTRNVGAVDLVEVAPNLDPSEVTQKLAATAIASFIGPRLSQALAEPERNV